MSWRNHPVTRKASFSQDEISAVDHHRWFVGKLEDPGCALLIIEDEGHPVGQVRLDLVAPDLAEISISLAADARGRGVGREALGLAASEASRLLGAASIRALVKPDNEASLRAFRAAGYRVVGREHDVIELLHADANQTTPNEPP